MKNIAFFLCVLQSRLLLSGTVEVNPGPNTSQEKKISFAFWNLDSLPARDFARIPLIKAFQNTYNFDMFGVCQDVIADIHLYLLGEMGSRTPPLFHSRIINKSSYFFINNESQLNGNR